MIGVRPSRELIFSPLPAPEAVRPPFHGPIRRPSGARFSAGRPGVYGVAL